MGQEYEPRTTTEMIDELDTKKKESEKALAARRKSFLPACEAEGKYVYLSFHGHEYTLHPDAARKLAQMLLDAADNTEDTGKQTTLDDAFVKGLGYPSLEAFKESLSRQIEIDKDRQNRLDVENQIVGALLKESKLIVPKSLVKKQLEYRLGEAKRRFESQGLPEEEIKKKENEMRKELKDVVEKDVKVYLVLDKIAQLEGITVGENENLPQKVMGFLLKEASWKDEEAKKK